MTCYHPLQGWQSLNSNSAVQKIPGFVYRGPKLIFKPPEDYWNFKAVRVPCGQCTGCRIRRSRDWAIRCMHETQLHHDNCFITLTYDNAHLPSDNSLHVYDFQCFMKRLRKRFSGTPIRYYHCGEYGDKYGRPHYHSIIFGLDFYDKKLFTMRGEHSLYTSQCLSELWPFGFSSIGSVTFDSAAYVARYIMKKRLGPSAKEHYTRVDSTTGEIIDLKPEYTTMSRRPGIGKQWLDKYIHDVYPDDFLVFKGTKFPPPKFYDNVYELVDPDGFAIIKSDRVAAAENRASDNTPERLVTREAVLESKLQLLSRPLDSIINY